MSLLSCWQPTDNRYKTAVKLVIGNTEGTRYEMVVHNIIQCAYPCLKAALGLQSGKYDIHGCRKDTDKHRLQSPNISVSGKSTETMTEYITNTCTE